MNLHCTPRESKIAELLSYGMSQKEIAELLGCSVNTIDAHIKNIKAKTGLQKNTEIECAYLFKKYRLPVIDIPEKIRKRIALALLALSVYGCFVDADFLRVFRVRTGRPVRTETSASRIRRSRRDDYILEAA